MLMRVSAKGSTMSGMVLSSFGQRFLIDYSCFGITLPCSSSQRGLSMKLVLVKASSRIPKTMNYNQRFSIDSLVFGIVSPKRSADPHLYMTVCAAASCSDGDHFS